MKSNYKTLEDYIQPVDVRNKDLKIEKLLGVSITKKIIPSIANTIGTDFSGYKIVKQQQFAYGPVTSRNGEKVSIALLEDDKCIISSSYSVFEVIDTNVLNPEYLMMWFRRPEFDRYARFKSHGSVREIFDWDTMCSVEFPVPSIEKQKAIVKAYKIVTDRIELKKKINEKLEEMAQGIFEKTFKCYYADDMALPGGWNKLPLEKLCDVKGGKRLPPDNELLDTQTEHPYIRVRDIPNNKYVYLTNQFQYIDEHVYTSIARYTVSTNDIIISIVGTIGLIGKIHKSLDRANLTENCVKLTGIHQITPDYLYHTLMYKRAKNEIELLTVGAVQSKLPIYNIQSIKIVVPNNNVMTVFQNGINPINKMIESTTIEIEKLRGLVDILLSKLSQ